MKTTILIALCAAMFFMGGCAVMTVDVDVYKGPLSNDAETQMEQLVAMPGAARPLLFELRNALSGKKTEDLRDEFVNGLNDDANQVQAILSLYWNIGDLPGRAVKNFERRAQAALAAYRQEDPDDPSLALEEYLRALKDLAEEVETNESFVRDPNRLNAGLSKQLANIAPLFDNVQVSPSSELENTTKAVQNLPEKIKKTTTLPPVETLESVQAELLDSLRFLGHEHGRLEKGLFSLIEAYLKETDHEEYPHVLIRELTVFATKILFLANNKSLVATARNNDDKIQIFTTGLQAIGNAILVGCDEITKQYGHKDHPTFSRIEDMDKEIADLQEEIIDELKNNGPSSTTTNLQSALGVVKEYRNSLTYLRPASSYLRSSYTATAVQQGTQVGWKNMLAEQHTRAFNILNLTGPDRGRREKLIGDIDRLSWQRVNEVRVAGGGKTTYVLAKDDIGNWYVKNFQGEVTNVINSMKNLATFALKTAVPATSTEALQAAASKSPGGNTVTNISGLAVALTNLQSQSFKSTGDLFTTVLTTVQTHHAKISALPAPGVAAQATALQAAVTLLNDFQTRSATQDRSKPDLLRAELDLGFRTLYRAYLHMRDVPPAATEMTALKDSLTSLVRRRDEALKEYSAGLNALNAGTN